MNPTSKLIRSSFSFLFGSFYILILYFVKIAYLVSTFFHMAKSKTG